MLGKNLILYFCFLQEERNQTNEQARMSSDIYSSDARQTDQVKETPSEGQHCSKPLKQRRSLRSQKRIQMGEKRFQCNYCSKSFPYSSALRRHEDIHTRERPFKCNFCSQMFTRKNSL